MQDLFFLFIKDFILKINIGLDEKKYVKSFFEDIKDFSVDFIRENYNVEEIKDFFKKEVYRLQSKIISK